MRKIMNIFITIFCVMILMTSVVLAEGNGFGTFTPNTDKIQEEAGSTASSIIGYIRWIGYAIAAGMIIYIGIKYVMSSADEKANLKGAMIKYLIGAVLIIGAVTIADWIFAVGEAVGS